MPERFNRPAIATAPLSLVLLVYPQKPESLEIALAAWISYADSLGRDYEVLLSEVDRTQPSSTLSELPTANNPHITVLPNPSQCGVGAALKTGLAKARYPLCLYADCNAGYEPTDIRLFLEAIDQVDLVAGFRESKSARRWSFQRFLRSWLVRIFFGVRLKDVDCSFKLFRREILGRIPIQSNGAFAHAEIVAKANFLGCLMCEVPVSFARTEGAAAKAQNSSRYWAEASQVFRFPDFGPAILPSQPAPVTRQG